MAQIHNVRVCTLRREELRAEMARVGCEPEGVERMVPKARHFVVKVQNLRTPAALILKEEMLAKGGDCAIHRDVITHRVERSDCLLMCTEKTLRLALDGLRAQPFGLARLADEIQSAVESFQRAAPVLPDANELPERLRPFYAALRERTLVMGILNVTPDSFSDGGLHGSVEAAVEHGARLAEEGADAIDVGGESTRPGAEPVSAAEEIARVEPVVRALSARVSVPISIDTLKPEVARAALDAGASIINDISGLSHPEMRALAAERRAPAVIMHMQGTPRTMQERPTYDDLISEIACFLRERIAAAAAAGLPEEYTIIDPGIGFGKTVEHNLEIIRRLAELKSIGRPILLGASRKGFIGKITGITQASERTEGTAAVTALGIANGANIVRVHDVRETLQTARVADAVVR